MKRQTFVRVMQEFAGDYIISGFRGQNPFEEVNASRFLLEHAFIKYMLAHKKYTLCKVEDLSWTIFHTNAKDSHLLETRKRFYDRENIEEYMNSQLCDDPMKMFYYGYPVIRTRANLRDEIGMSFGRTHAGKLWRKIKSYFRKSPLNIV